MGYCKNCGAKLKDRAQFCGMCGQPVSMVGAGSNQKTIHSTDQESPQSATRHTYEKSKRTNLKMIIALIVLILLGGAYYFLDKIYYSPHKVFEDFTSAIDAKDISSVKSYINNGQREMKATNEQTEKFIDYLKDNPKIYSELYTNLKTEVDLYRNKGNRSENSTELSSIANLKDNGEKWGLFDDYVIEIKPSYVNVTSGYNNTEIQVDGEKIGKINDEHEKNFGPFLPGEHAIKAIVNGDYGKVEQKTVFDDSRLEDRTTSVLFNWSDYFLNVYTNENDAILFINGKSTGKTLEEIDELGPVALDGSVKVHAERKVGNKTIKSDPVTIKEGMYSVEFLFNPEENEISRENVESDKRNDSDEAIQIESVIYSHYQNITDDNFVAAYQLFSSEKRSSVSLKDWSKGLKDNQVDKVDVVDITEVTATTAIAYVEMTSYDVHGDGKSLVQKWGGNWHLVKENGSWYLNKAKLSKLSSKIQS